MAFPVVLATLLATLQVLSVTVAPVLAYCNPGRTSNGLYYFDGGSETPGGTTRGVSSSIYAYDAYVPSNAISWAWVMLAKNGLNWAWAQIGNYEVVGHVRHTTIQYA